MSTVCGPWGGLEGRSTGREQRLERPCRPLYWAVSWAWPNGAVGLTGFWLMNLVWATQWGKWGPHRAGSDGSEGEPYILCGTEWGASAVNGGWGWCVHVSHPHQDPGSAVLNILELLKAPARNPDEECITIVQPGGDKSMDELLCSRKGKGGAQFGNVS